MSNPDGRRFAPTLECATGKDEQGRPTLLAPRPGRWRGAPQEGTLVRPGDAVGELEVLGVCYGLRAPKGVYGVVGGLPEGRRLARRPVDAGTVLMHLDPDAVGGAAEFAEAEGATRHGGPVFETPLGGRYYARPSPEAEAFCAVGDSLKGGETIAIIEVMKTFNRVQYAGEPATIARIVPADGDDVNAGDVLIELEH